MVIVHQVKLPRTLEALVAAKLMQALGLEQVIPLPCLLVRVITAVLAVVLLNTKVAGEAELLR